MTKKILGKHWLIEVFDCSFEILNDINFLQDTLLFAAKEAKATVINDFFYKFSPYGISGVIVIKESHITIHTFPEYNYAAIDIFTCGKINNKIILDVIKDKFQTKKIKVKKIKRGKIKV